jgi:hypothetical protein
MILGVQPNNLNAGYTEVVIRALSTRRLTMLSTEIPSIMTTASIGKARLCFIF